MAKARPSVESLQQEIDPESDLYGVLYGTRAEDLTRWIEDFLTIPNEQGRIVPMKLYPQQRLMAQNRTFRDITVKGRQTRASSFILAKNLRRMTTEFGLNCFVMTIDDSTTETFRARIKHHLEDLHRNGLDYEIKLDNSDELVIGGLENRFIWASAEQRIVGRAYTSHLVHLSEAAHYKADNEGAIVGGLIPGIPEPPYGWLDVESTPNGAEGLFYEMVQDSRPIVSDSLMTTHFYPWWIEPRYNVDTWDEAIGLPAHYHELIAQMRRDFSPSPDEEKLIARGLRVGQILWRRLKIREMVKTTTPFLQEYVEDLETCFLSTSESFFASEDGVDHLAHHRENRQAPVVLKESLSYKGSPVNFQGANLHVWELPIPGDAYAMYQDTSKGGTSKEADPSVITVMHAQSRHIVAKLVVKATPREIAAMGCAIGEHYNHALYGGERDAWGAQSLERVRELSYPNVFYYVDPARRTHDPEAWIYPTRENRNALLLKLRDWVFSHSLTIKDATLLSEMGAFTWLKVRSRDQIKAAGRRSHDDHVLSAAGCCVVAERAAMSPRKVRSAEQDLVVGKHGVVLRRDNSNHVRPWFS